MKKALVDVVSLLVSNKKIICFDIDGVICNNTWGDYLNAKPHQKAIDKINHLYEIGNKIILFTARFMGKHNESKNKAYDEGFEFTKNQLNSWGVKYHELKMGKPSYDIIVDDKHFNYDNKWIEDL
jgi:uncharacterized HAD superfamily protein